MLGMMLQATPRLELRIKGGASETIFPEVEEWLEETTDRMRALDYVASREKMEQYRSVVDFLVCEVFINERWACRRFYAGKGPRLRYIVTSLQRDYYARGILIALEMAYAAWCAKRRLGWAGLRDEALMMLG